MDDDSNQDDIKTEERLYQPPTPMKFTRSAIANMTPAEYQKNRAEILRSRREGAIEDDITTLQENIQEANRRKEEQ